MLSSKISLLLLTKNKTDKFYTIFLWINVKHATQLLAICTYCILTSIIPAALCCMCKHNNKRSIIKFFSAIINNKNSCVKNFLIYGSKRESACPNSVHLPKSLLRDTLQKRLHFTVTYQQFSVINTSTLKVNIWSKGALVGTLVVY